MKECQVHGDLNWTRYIADQVPNRGDYEAALAHCPDCQEVFTTLVAENLSPLPRSFVLEVMAGLPKKANRWQRLKPLLHYAAAACLTLAMLELGVFDLIPGLPEYTRDVIPQGSDFINTLNEQLRGLISLLKY